MAEQEEREGRKAWKTKGKKSMVERIDNWVGIADFLGVQMRTAQRRKSELERAGILFYRSTGKGKRRNVYTYTNLMQIYMIKKNKEKFEEKSSRKT